MWKARRWAVFSPTPGSLASCATRRFSGIDRLGVDLDRLDLLDAVGHRGDEPVAGPAFQRLVGELLLSLLDLLRELIGLTDEVIDVDSGHGLLLVTPGPVVRRYRRRDLGSATFGWGSRHGGSSPGSGSGAAGRSGSSTWMCSTSPPRIRSADCRAGCLRTRASTVRSCAARWLASTSAMLCGARLAAALSTISLVGRPKVLERICSMVARPVPLTVERWKSASGVKAITTSPGARRTSRPKASDLPWRGEAARTASTAARQISAEGGRG